MTQHKTHDMHHGHQQNHNHCHAGHHGGGGGHMHHHHGNFKELFFKSLPFALVIMLISPMMGLKLPLQFTFNYSDIVASVLATVLLVIGGKPFYEGAWMEFKNKAPGMMALVAMGISVSYLYSIIAVIMRYTSNEQPMDFFFELASLILIMLLGHWLEMKAVMDAGDAEASLAKLLPKEAERLDSNGEVTKVAISDLKQGDIVRVQAGENIPADGQIIKGQTRVNEALLTGESKPVAKEVDDQVIGGSTNESALIHVKVEEVGSDSFVAQVQALIAEAQGQPSKAESLAQKVASWLFYIALGAALIAFAFWSIKSDLQTAIRYTVTTLVIACPHALGLAIPLVAARSTSLGAHHGLLVKDRETLELATQADTMILDKTGTLTTGEFKVLAVEPLSADYSTTEILALLAGLEAGSSHPIAQSISQYAETKAIKPKAFDAIEILSGKGVKGEHQSSQYELLSEQAYDKSHEFTAPKGSTVSLLIKDQELIGAVALGDEIKASSKHLIQTLKQTGIEVIMATGDNEQAARAVAESLSIDYMASQTPEDKYQLVKDLKAKNKKVMMVGDGVNDAPALALADVGIAVGAGTQVALDSADIVLVHSDPADIEALLILAKRTNRKMKENLLWGAGYNFIAIPLAAGLLAPLGIILSPVVGAILMSLSTVIVAINAMLLKLN